jgi:hypothetical protein
MLRSSKVWTWQAAQETNLQGSHHHQAFKIRMLQGSLARRQAQSVHMRASYDGSHVLSLLKTEDNKNKQRRHQANCNLPGPT